MFLCSSRFSVSVCVFVSACFIVSAVCVFLIIQCFCLWCFGLCCVFAFLVFVFRVFAISRCNGYVFVCVSVFPCVCDDFT